MATAPSRIRVKLKGYDAKVIDRSAKSIIETAIRTGAKVSGPIPLPTKLQRFTVNRSPHVYKRSMEHFEMRTHKRLIDILEPTAQTIDSLQHLQVPAGVGIEIM
jgi:small subunit ribosomal protein S10